MTFNISFSGSAAILTNQALFGGGYRSSAVSIMKHLIAKYGSKDC